MRRPAVIVDRGLFTYYGDESLQYRVYGPVLWVPCWAGVFWFAEFARSEIREQMVLDYIELRRRLKDELEARGIP